MWRAQNGGSIVRFGGKNANGHVYNYAFGFVPTESCTDTQHFLLRLICFKKKWISFLCQVHRQDVPSCSAFAKMMNSEQPGVTLQVVTFKADQAWKKATVATVFPQARLEYCLC
jgi:hypothetical protein